MKRDDKMTVNMAMIRVCRESLKGFSRYKPQPLEIVIHTAMGRATSTLPMVCPEVLKKEILCRIVTGKLVSEADMVKAVAMLEVTPIQEYFEEKVREILMPLKSQQIKTLEEVLEYGLEKGRSLLGFVKEDCLFEYILRASVQMGLLSADDTIESKEQINLIIQMR